MYYPVVSLACTSLWEATIIDVWPRLPCWGNKCCWGVSWHFWNLFSVGKITCRNGVGRNTSHGPVHPEMASFESGQQWFILALAKNSTCALPNLLDLECHFVGHLHCFDNISAAPLCETLSVRLIMYGSVCVPSNLVLPWKIRCSTVTTWQCLWTGGNNLMVKIVLSSSLMMCSILTLRLHMSPVPVWYNIELHSTPSDGVLLPGFW